MYTFVIRKIEGDNMIKSFAFHILKGGVGKTSLSGNIAYYIGQNKKTILIDCDIQSNSTNWFYPDMPSIELADVLQGNHEVKEATIELSDNFYLLPTKKQNSNLKLYSETQLFNEPFIFEDLLKELEKLGFEIAVFDLSPSISQLERCILLAVNEVITPLTPEYFSYDGVELFNSELQKINKSYRKKIRHKKIVINNINQSFSTHKAYLDAINKLTNYEIFTIPQDRKIADSQINNKSIFEYDKNSKTIPELQRLSNAMIGANFGNKEKHQ